MSSRVGSSLVSNATTGRFNHACLLVFCLLGLTLPLSSANAVEVSLVGIFGNKAVLIVDGGTPRTYSIGQRSPDGVRLVGISSATHSAKVEVGGVARQIQFGLPAVRIAAADEGDGSKTTALVLIADIRGHHHAEGSVNGAPLRFLVDTGATTVSLGMNDAKRARLNLDRASEVTVQTASGRVKAWRTRLDTVKVGPLVLHGVDAIVMENDLPVALLGMSFLSRTSMERDGDRLSLRKRF